jgi:hypothetical protein
MSEREWKRFWQRRKIKNRILTASYVFLCPLRSIHPPRDVLYTQKKAYGTQSLGIQNSYSNMRFLKGFAALFKTKYWIDLEVWRTLI